MTKKERLSDKLKDKQRDGNWRFKELIKLLENLGFQENGGKGSHRVFTKLNLEEIINIQEESDGKAKKYQVNQVRKIVEKHKLGG